MFRILWDPSPGTIKRASLKLLVTFCVRSRCLAAWNLDLWCVCLVRLVAPGIHTTVPRCRSPNPCLLLRYHVQPDDGHHKGRNI